MPAFNAVICRFGEIALKGGNRPRFEKMLARSIRKVVSSIGNVEVYRLQARLLVARPDDSDFSDSDIEFIKTQLPKVFGLESFSPGIKTAPDVAEIEEAVAAAFPGVYEEVASRIPDNQPITFRVRARRSNKSFPLTSVELNKRLADQIIPSYERLRVDLKEAELSVYVEVAKKWSFTCFTKYDGPGGLPVGSGAHGLSLLSGGIDSPVACYHAMKRGCWLDYLTFHSFPYTPPESVYKVARIAEVLNCFQASGKLFACNMVEAQKAIRDSCLDSYRTIYYRRMMMRVANVVAAKLRAEVLITGESLGQVCSQTAPNLTLIDEAADPLVLRPLITMDKQETVDLAIKIGTFDISAEQCADSCTVFQPPSPASRAKLDRVLDEESRLDIPGLLEECLAETKLIDLKTGDPMLTEPWR